MAVSELLNLSAVLDDARCFDPVRQHRWRQDVRCPGCDSAAVIGHGRDEA
jgi:transposase-like protein